MQNSDTILDRLHSVGVHMSWYVLLDALQRTPIAAKGHAVTLEPVEIDGDPINRKFVLVSVEVMQRLRSTRTKVPKEVVRA